MTQSQLTERQKDVYDLIRSLIQERGYGPTVREIGEHFGIKSPNGVMCHLRALERKGLITRRANKSRAIELIGDNARSITGLPMMGIISEHATELNLHPTDAIDLGKTLATGDRFVVQVSGNAFEDRGVRDGDFLIMDQSGENVSTGLLLCKTALGSVVLIDSEKSQTTRSGAMNGYTPIGAAVSLVRERL